MNFYRTAGCNDLMISGRGSGGGMTRPSEGYNFSSKSLQNCPAQSALAIRTMVKIVIEAKQTDKTSLIMSTLQDLIELQLT